MHPKPRHLTILLLAASCLFGQAAPPTAADTSLSQGQIRDLIRQAAENDIANDKASRDYSYVQRETERKLNGKGNVQSTETRTYDVLMLYGEAVRRQIAKNDQPLSAKDAAREEEKLQKIIDKRQNEDEGDRRKRLDKEEKDREQDREFVKEIADAYNFRFDGLESYEGRPTYVIDADPRPGYEPHGKNARFLPDFRFRVWLDEQAKEWVKLDIQCIDTVSVGLFLARVHKGSNIQIEQTRVNDEVWLPRHVALKLDARIALFKGVNIAEEANYSDYKKFRTDTKILPAGITEQQQPQQQQIQQQPQQQNDEQQK